MRNREGGSGRNFNDNKFRRVEGKILKRDIGEVYLGIRVEVNNAIFPFVMERSNEDIKGVGRRRLHKTNVTFKVVEEARRERHDNVTSEVSSFSFMRVKHRNAKPESQMDR